MTDEEIIRHALIERVKRIRLALQSNPIDPEYWEEALKRTYEVLDKLHTPKEYDYKSQKLKEMYK